MRETSQPIEVNIPAANYSPIPPADDIAQVFNIINNKGYIFPYTPRTLTIHINTHLEAGIHLPDIVLEAWTADAERIYLPLDEQTWEILVAWPPTRFLLSLWEGYLEGEASEVEESDEEVEEEERMGDRRSSMASLVRFGKRIWRGEEAEEMGGERGREREREEGDGIQWTASEILSL